MPPLGAHMSIAGGVHKAVERGSAVGCACVQIFSKNNAQWRARALSSEECVQFRAALLEHAISHPLIHASYLINLASPDKQLREKSLGTLIDEVLRGAQLGVPYVVVHPGAYTTGTEATGIRRVVRAIDEVSRQTRDAGCRLLVETTAGQGTSIGWRFEHLARILDGVRDPDQLGICFDTCHVHAAGYDLRTEKAWDATWKEWERLIEPSRIKAFHLNDSRNALGSRVDRHEHIGQGHVGLASFRRLLRDPRFAETPMYLETPKGTSNGEDWDVINLRTLRRLARRAVRHRD